jgi:hypothetical protein
MGWGLSFLPVPRAAALTKENAKTWGRKTGGAKPRSNKTQKHKTYLQKENFSFYATGLQKKMFTYFATHQRGKRIPSRGVQAVRACGECDVPTGHRVRVNIPKKHF